mgnify:CR=1 FL=1
MQGIEFEEDKNYQGLKAQALAPVMEKQGFIMKLVMKTGVTDRATVNLILLAVAAIFFGITIYLYAGILGNNAPVKLTQEQIAEQQRVMKEMMDR